MGNPLTGLTGFPRAPASVRERIRRPLNRLAALAVGLVQKSFAQVSVAAGDTVANTVAETAFAQQYAVPANTIAPGTVFRVAAMGEFSSTANPTLRLRLKLGATVVFGIGSPVIASDGASSLWTLTALVTFGAVGAAGTFEQGGAVLLYEPAGPQAASSHSSSPVSLDTTGALTLTLSATWGVAAAGNTITLRQMLVETLP